MQVSFSFGGIYMTIDLLGLICNSLASHHIMSLSYSSLQKFSNKDREEFAITGRQHATD